MPTYEYECKDCGQTFEKFQSITARRLTRCPVCAGRVERMIGSGSAVIFRGSGFYQTDYRSSEYKKQAGADKDATPSKGKASKTDSSETKSKSSKPDDSARAG